MGAIMKKRVSLVGFLLLLLLLMACEPEPAPTVVPTVTLTPHPEGLVIAPTSVAPGLPERPIEIFLLRDQPLDDKVAADFASLILDTTSVSVVVKEVGTDSDLINALCNNSGEEPVMIWADALNTAIVLKNNCATLLLSQSIEPNESLSVIYNSNATLTSLSSLSRFSRLCRVDDRTKETYWSASLLLAANNLDMASFEQMGYKRLDDALSAINRDECDFLVTYTSHVPDFSEDSDSKFNVLDAEVILPSSSLLIPVIVPQAARLALLNNLIDLEWTEEQADLLTEVFGTSEFMLPDLELQQKWLEWLDNTEFDWKQVGN